MALFQRLKFEVSIGLALALAGCRHVPCGCSFDPCPCEEQKLAEVRRQESRCRVEIAPIKVEVPPIKVDVCQHAPAPPPPAMTRYEEVRPAVPPRPVVIAAPSPQPPAAQPAVVPLSAALVQPAPAAMVPVQMPMQMPMAAVQQPLAYAQAVQAVQPVMTAPAAMPAPVAYAAYAPAAVPAPAARPLLSLVLDVFRLPIPYVRLETGATVSPAPVVMMQAAMPTPQPAAQAVQYVVVPDPGVQQVGQPQLGAVELRELQRQMEAFKEKLERANK